jgi:serine protease SohB
VPLYLTSTPILFTLVTAGKHKRTVDIIGDVTEEGKAKLKEELDDIHTAFKDHVALARPVVREKMEEIATGEYWLAVHAKKKGLVDEIMTSDEFLESISQENEIIEIVEKKRKSVWSGFHAAALSVKGEVDEMTVRHNGSPAPMARA